MVSNELFNKACTDYIALKNEGTWEYLSKDQQQLIIDGYKKKLCSETKLYAKASAEDFQITLFNAADTLANISKLMLEHNIDKLQCNPPSCGLLSFTQKEIYEASLLCEYVAHLDTNTFK